MNNDAPLPNDLLPAAVDVSHCSQHHYRPNLGGGICASCLKEKLCKLVSSSSFPLPLHHPFSSSSSAASSPPSSELSSSSSSKRPNLVYDRSHWRRAKIPSFLYSKKKKKKKKKNRKYHSPSPAVTDRAAELALRRSNTAPKRPEHLDRFLDGDILEYRPQKKGFWSFLYLSAGNHPSASASRQRHSAPDNSATSSSSTSALRADRTMPFSNDVSKKCSEVIPEDDDVGSAACDGNNFERKVSRSRSVGCGSRSFSGDFFERISTGFGDCTFRRVESLRGTDGHGHTRHRFSTTDADYRMKERVKCSRIFSGFMTASSSSFLPSSLYLISTSSREGHPQRGANGVRSAVPTKDGLNGRSRSWGGWVFAGPTWVFGCPSSSKDVKSCNATPNINAIPSSLLTVGG